MASDSTEQLNSSGNKRGMHPNSRKNLSKPGHTNNPNGRVASILSITSLVKEELVRIPTMEEDGFDGKGKSNAWWIARNAVRDARKGDRTARQEVWERLEGKVTQPIGTPEGRPLEVTVIEKVKDYGNTG